MRKFWRADSSQPENDVPAVVSGLLQVREDRVFIHSWGASVYGRYACAPHVMLWRPGLGLADTLGVLWVAMSSSRNLGKVHWQDPGHIVHMVALDGSKSETKTNRGSVGFSVSLLEDGYRVGVSVPDGPGMSGIASTVVEPDSGLVSVGEYVASWLAEYRRGSGHVFHDSKPGLGARVLPQAGVGRVWLLLREQGVYVASEVETDDGWVEGTFRCRVWPNASLREVMAIVEVGLASSVAGGPADDDGVFVLGKLARKRWPKQFYHGAIAARIDLVDGVYALVWVQVAQDGRSLVDAADPVKTFDDLEALGAAFNQRVEEVAPTLAIPWEHPKVNNHSAPSLGLHEALYP